MPTHPHTLTHASAAPTQMYIISMAIVFAQQYAYYLQFPGKMHNK